MSDDFVGFGHPREELASTVTHAVGLVLSVLALVWLVWVSTHLDGWIRSAGHWIYGGSLVFLYSASTLYHAARHPRRRHLWRVIDHIGVYVLIAGTCTPIALVVGGVAGWTLFVALWSITAIGVFYKSLLIDRYQAFSVAQYIAMGWLGALVFEPAVAQLGWGGAMWMIAGGVAYTGGVFFYLRETLPYNHAMWHLCVMGGSLCHFIAIAGVA